MALHAFLPVLPLRQNRTRHYFTIQTSRRSLTVAVAPSPNPPKTPIRPIIRTDPAPDESTSTSSQKSQTLPEIPSIPPPPPSPFSYVWPRLLLLAIAIIWGTNFPVVKLLHTPPAPLPVPTAALARFSLAAVSMLPLIPLELNAASRKSFPLPFLVSTLSIGVAISFGYFSQSIALMSTDASTSAFICSLAVVIVPAINRVARLIGWNDQTANRGLLATWGAPFLAVVGVAMLEFGGTPPSIGDVWAFVQAAGFAMGFVLNDRLAAKYPDLVFSQSALQLNVVAVLALVWATIDCSTTAGAFTFPHISDAFVNGTNALAVFYTGLITTALTVWLENVALKKVSAGELAVLLSTEPFWAAALAAVLLNETIGPWSIVGGITILMACVVNQASDVADILGKGPGKTDTQKSEKTIKDDLVTSAVRDEKR